MPAPKTLFEYFEENWNREPHAVIDHSLRIAKVPNGYHFYIHPSNTDGSTVDFVVTKDGIYNMHAEYQEANDFISQLPIDVMSGSMSRPTLINAMIAFRHSKKV